MALPEDRRLTVVKLGGSLVQAPELRRWLAAVVEAAGRHVVVPGGGPFADAVRKAQAPLRLSERACHRMALLAMAQFGCAFTAIEPRLVAAASVTEAEEAIGRGAVPVWLPLDLLPGLAEIEESWRVTSDSLAAWLATRLGADRLLLVKSGEVADGEATAVALAASGLVDEAFPDFRSRYRGDVLLAHRSAVRLAGFVPLLVVRRCSM